MIGTKAKTLDSNATGIVKNPREPCDITPHFEKVRVTKSIQNACVNENKVVNVKSNEIAYLSNDDISEPWQERMAPSGNHRALPSREVTPEQSSVAQKPLSETLMEMASYRQISATAYTIKVGDTSTYNNNSPCSKNTSDPGIVRKIYIPTYLNKVRLVGCMDSGSDITILQQSMYDRIFHNRDRKLTKSDIPFITTFSDTHVKIIGKLHTFMKLSVCHPGLLITVYIIQDIPNVPVFLIGNDVFKLGLVTLSYTGDLQDPYPEIIFNNPEKFICPVYYDSALDVYDCELECDIEPQETQDVIVKLPRIAPLIRTDHILITSINWSTIIITPSRSDIEFMNDKDYFIATAQATNLGKSHFTGTIKAKYELVNSSHVYTLEDKEDYQLKELLTKHPLAREILYTSSQSRDSYRYPYLTVNEISIASEKDIQVSDLDYADIIKDKEPIYGGEAVIESEIIEAKGLELPTMVYETALDAVSLHSFSEEIRPFIKDIFVDKYPEVVSLHSLDAGNLSLTLGYTQLRLREGETLPRSRRIFHISPNDTRHLEDICDLLIKFGFIKKANLSPNGCHLYGMSAYLVPRAKPNCLGRLIIDYSPVNQLIQSPSAVIPEIEATLQFLQGKALFTSLDLRYAYLGLRIDEESRKLTTFITPTGTYEWIALPTGAANSPAYFTDACNRMLHFEPEYDEQGNVIYESANVVKQKPSPLKYVCNYFDDILCTSPLKTTYHDTLTFHFNIVEQCIKRLAFHGSKINVPKCDFAKSKILFLGWYVSHDFVIADPRRIQKVKDFKFPDSKKSVRAFLGLVNSLRRVLPMDVIEQVAILTPLTSSRAEFKIEAKHKEAFNQIKEMLIKEPVFCHLINERAEKYLWVDAATGSGVLGAVLAQKLQTDNEEKIVPTCLDLDDPIHRIIFDKELQYEPAILYTESPIEIPKPSMRKTVPPKITQEKPLLGFTSENVHDSFFWSTLSILAIYGCASKTDFTPQDLRKLAVTKAKEGILGNKLLDFIFNLDKNAYKQFMEDFTNGITGLDPEYILADALARQLSRPMILISSLKKHQDNPIIKFNSQSDKPPLVYGIYERNGHEIFLPYFHNRDVEFKIDSLKGKIQIIAYVAKTVPETFRSRSILDLETFAILSALSTLHRYISNVKVKLFTDSRVLYYLFSPTVGHSSVKIKRWCLKLISDYPNVTLHFIRTNENLADFLTREGLPPGDLQKFNIKDIQISDFSHELPKAEFTFQEWINFVADNPQYLTINNPSNSSKQEKPTNKDIKAITLAITYAIDNIKETLQPIDILRQKLERHILVRQQKAEFADIYTQCLAAKKFEYIPEINNDPNSPTFVKYKLVGDLLLIYKQNYRIYVPPSLVGYLLSYTHLLGHKGITRMIADLQSYYFEKMYTQTKELVQSCYACFLTNKGTRHSKLGSYKSPDYPFQEINIDLAENLNPINNYAHLLVVQCALTDFILIYPLKSKQAEHVTHTLLHSVLMPFNVRRIHSDNGPCFRSTHWLEIMASLNIQIIASAALHPQGRGSIERQIGLIKQMLKKMLATRPTLNWEYLPFLIAKIMNNSVSTKTGFKPQEFVFGSTGKTDSFLNLENWTQPHYLVRNNKQKIDDLTTEIKEMIAIATDKYTEHKLLDLEYQNKNRIEKRFKKGDYVFVLDRTYIPGNSRPLKTRFHPSPYVVIDTRHTTTRVKRLADNFESVYGNDDLKKYDKTSPLFAQLPPQVSRVLLHDFENLLNSDLCTIAKFDTLNGPNGMQLFDNDIDDPENDNNDNNEDILPNLNSNIHNQNSSNENQLSQNQTLQKQTIDIQDEILNDPLDAVITNFTQNQTIQPNYHDVQDNILNSLKQKSDLPKNPDDVNLNPQNVTIPSPILPQHPQKSKDRAPDILDNVHSDSEDETDPNLLTIDTNTSNSKKVTFQDT
ncbi:MAG: DDE-type integrase/transposase/recombinase [Cylindrospermopsis raciborskii KL1]|uniref:reverse transcriptase domain-containing protein n=1 Tax=Cylindrospermopsis raciborskii TaxID=77022 RepID=UPI001A33013E|nr:reverse transcriptase domain-containing protein [Cylindrospermopsis raciborskii]MBG0744848.1 DDE-type integrase/transposase/recombinase [Cylindrospermopsis raciborskii KL1]